MLQISPIDLEGAAGAPPTDFSRFLSPRFYWDLVKRRFLHFVIPVIIILPLGAFVVMSLPALYVSEGKILVESQRIPIDLVKPTVTSMAAERIQVLEQRLLARDNVMGIIDKFKLFSDRRSLFSASELVELMRQRTRIQPIELAVRRGAADRVSMAFTIGFEYENPELAAKVAGEFVTQILNEDLRGRTARASETTRFLSREVSRLQAELTAVESQQNELKRKQAEAETAAKEAAREHGRGAAEQTLQQLAALKAERLTKANKLSFNHPEVQAIQRKIVALERSTTGSTEQPVRNVDVEIALESLKNRQSGLEASLEQATQKLTAARLGEALERDQQAEKFEVLEQPVVPQRSTKPNREKLLMLVIGAAFAAGLGLALASETFDSTIRTEADLGRLVESRLIVPIPHVASRRDRTRRRIRAVAAIAVIIAVVGSGLIAAYYFAPPWDLLWAQARIQFFRVLSR